MLLMAHGADVNFVNEEDYNRTPVHTSVIQAMQIATKYDMDEIDGLDGEDGIVSKERAEEWKYDRQASINILECLALHSADLNTQDSHGRTPMHYAADDERGSHIMHWLVVRKARTDICDTLVLSTFPHPPNTFLYSPYLFYSQIAFFLQIYTLFYFFCFYFYFVNSLFSSFYIINILLQGSHGCSCGDDTRK